MESTFCKTVWLIDDDDLSNYVNTTILNTWRFAQSIVSFTSVQEALDSLDLAVKEKIDFPDIIFLDMEMPGLDGWDFLNIFRLLPNEVKEECCLFMLSSSINEADALRAKKYEDVHEFLVKPLGVESLENIKKSGVCFKLGRHEG